LADDGADIGECGHVLLFVVGLMGVVVDVDEADGLFFHTLRPEASFKAEF
jgi:hypothetical protein